MGVYYETIPDSLVPWIQNQKMLWVGTAPLSPTGHINVSPKGSSTGGTPFGVLSPTKFWYIDLTGSGVETHAHLHEPNNGRICVMFAAFTGAAQIVRIWGTGTPLENGTPEFTSFVGDHKITLIPGARSIILIDVHQCATSCGWSVPEYEFIKHRTTLNDFYAKKDAKFQSGKTEESMDRYWAWKSQLSIDGLPGMKRGVKYARENGVKPLKKMVGRYAPGAPRTTAGVEPLHLLLVLLLGIIIGGAMAVSFITPEQLESLRKGRVII
ncbi:hypothetical protein P153DRAFT_327535 [Dothidotthia symphoricarpi CBS 119687]|uniref:Uncharacterized protein n=1 Tax=Dothidotthia symphoricarpi CBS 119687 TaxID=1392245 RepID=A0A6A5ZYJ7_9PLEO|nr:uncharacterized protein P153DRAFT_327535 [Dothidotthia symphoricarpi CBS 119687]KAF2123857.1 hypothetical protein P153DRAFT_327535 [Dothidotthia symphoricarpi CBS 119687]